MEDQVLLAEYTTNYKKTHSQTLIPMLEELRNMIELDLDTLDAIAVASGPGSFTGLRIGSATAKGLGLALKKPLVEVPTLEGLAWNLWGTDRLVCPLMDARRNQVYAAAYEFVPEGETLGLRTLIGQAPIDIAELLEKLNGLGREVVFLGDGSRCTWSGSGNMRKYRTVWRRPAVTDNGRPASPRWERSTAPPGALWPPGSIGRNICGRARPSRIRSRPG